MEFKKNIEFDKTVEAFKLMRLKDKHNVVIEELKETLVFLEMTMNSKDIKCEVLYNKEILDTQHDYTEDDFAESVYVYINAIKDLMAKYVEKEIE